MKELHVKTHCGLGDLFICEALLRIVSMSYDRVYFNTKPENLETARLLFAGRCANLIAVPTVTDYKLNVPDQCPDVLPLGLFSREYCQFGDLYPNGAQTFHRHAWDREFYRHAGIPFTQRWQSTWIDGMDIPDPIDPGSPVLVHEIPGCEIHHKTLRRDRAQFILPVAGRTILSWIPAMEQAEEIHCVDSSVINLVESMVGLGMIKANKTELFFHNTRKSRPPTLLAHWKVIL